MIDKEPTCRRLFTYGGAAVLGRSNMAYLGACCIPLGHRVACPGARHGVPICGHTASTRLRFLTLSSRTQNCGRLSLIPPVGASSTLNPKDALRHFSVNLFLLLLRVLQISMDQAAQGMKGPDLAQ